ncbi:hypothetical protein [Tropicimonas sp. IMCC6043]|uniref:hypothetical protein n=1 Tax=Tropicimonas sp. IMCC6043 TaxID=2510645 RepID=UPI00101D1604|nr:hypothetical protein [Tropicimonas sp. IMCC6043]RYH09843.1 hypothetical protein EU800_11435 [Tropicimonas sp. IMCC6043]
MKIDITGKNVTKDMRKIARDCFAEHGNVGCVTVGVARIGSSLGSSPRQVSGGTRHGYFALSGATGRTVLENALIGEGLATANTTAALQCTGRFQRAHLILRCTARRAQNTKRDLAPRRRTYTAVRFRLLECVASTDGRITRDCSQWDGPAPDGKLGMSRVLATPDDVYCFP